MARDYGVFCLRHTSTFLTPQVAAGLLAGEPPPTLRLAGWPPTLFAPRFNPDLPSTPALDSPSTGGSMGSPGSSREALRGIVVFAHSDRFSHAAQLRVRWLSYKEGPKFTYA